MINTVIIRDYKKTDKEDVINLIKKNIPEFFAPDEAADLKDYLETQRELYYVILYGGKIVGSGGINFENSKTTAKISWDIFHPKFQGKSLGTQLMKHRLAKLNSMGGIERIYVRTSQLAYRFYEKQGFQLLEIKKDYWAKGFHMYSMELQNF